MKKIINISILFVLAFLLTGCNWDGIFSYAGKFVCTYAPDSDHCFQWSAVQGGDPKQCEKIKGKKFADMGSNPPKDKCYLTIAQNKGDYSICKNIKGGPMSYTKDECVNGVGEKILDESIKNDDINGCIKLSKFPEGNKSSYDKCRSTLATPEKMKSGDEKIDEVIEKIKDDPDNAELIKQLENLKKAKQLTYEMMDGANQQKYFKEKREEIMKDIDDQDVASAISEEFISYKANETNVIKLLEKMEQITEKQKAIKRIDENANTLVDQVKGQLEGLVGDKKDEIIEQMGDNAKERIEKNGGSDLKWSLKNLEWSMEKYEKGSKIYEDAKAKYDKLKKVYDEVMGVYERIDKVNKMVAEGKIDKGKAKVLKGAVLLDKGLEYATEYVPVFGSTISTISKETFGTVIELAKKRAVRSTSLEDCFDDPANCDPDDISPY